jgi:hypothetical protein
MGLTRVNGRKRTGHSMDWTSYHPVADMQDFMAYLADTYSDFVSVVSIGKSYEGNDMQVNYTVRQRIVHKNGL